MKRLAVINAVGLTPGLLGGATPQLNALAKRCGSSTIVPAFPAVTCTAQANYLTGLKPSQHGIVGNGWYHGDLAEVQFWKQSNHLVRARKLFEDVREEQRGFTCAKLFWWYNMYSSADWTITPRPMYPADGRKVFDIYTQPATLRDDIVKSLGPFPFPCFWGPAAGVDTPQGKADGVSRWIAASAKWVEERHRPSLSLIYLPHLDYNFQRLGPDDPAVTNDVRMLDAIVGDLLKFFQERQVAVVVLSEYGLTKVQNPVHINRCLREQGWISVRNELGLELLDCGASKAFAVADHQVAHVYVQQAGLASNVKEYLENQVPGIERVLDRQQQIDAGIRHERAGDLVVIAKEDSWFSYYYWLDDDKAPDFARTVDIHRKPGYDPVELFLDPAIPLVKAKIAWRLLQKKLGFRILMDVIPLDATLVKGSHGRIPSDSRHHPLLLTTEKDLCPGGPIESTEVYWLLRRHLQPTQP